MHFDITKDKQTKEVENPQKESNNSFNYYLFFFRGKPIHFVNSIVPPRGADEDCLNKFLSRPLLLFCAIEKL